MSNATQKSAGPIVLVVRSEKDRYTWQVRGPHGGIALVSGDEVYPTAGAARLAGEEALSKYKAERR